MHERIVVANPLDYQMFDWNNEERLTPAFSAFLSQGFDLSLSLLDYPRSDKCDPSHWGGAERAFIRAARETGAAAAILATFTDTLPEPLAEQLLDDGIVPLAGIQAGLAGIQAAVDVGRPMRKSDCRPLLPVSEPATDSSIVIKNEADSKRMLAAYGIPVPESKAVTSAEGAVRAAQSLGYPVVVKALGVAHKTELGGVVLNLVSAEEVVMAVNSMNHLTQDFLVEKMVNGAVAELIVGVARDEQFGPHLVVGSGGIFVELLKDSHAGTGFRCAGKPEVCSFVSRLQRAAGVRPGGCGGRGCGSRCVRGGPPFNGCRSGYQPAADNGKRPGGCRG